MDVRGKVIIQSIMSESWIGPGGGTGRKACTHNSSVDLITNCDAYTLLPCAFAKTVKSSVIGGPKHQHMRKRRLT